MKKSERHNLITGLVTGAIALVLMFLIALFRFGSNELFNDPDNRFILFAFVPAWAFLIGYCGYYFSRKFYIQKINILGENLHNASEEKVICWNNYKRFIFSNAFNIIAKIALLLVPVYILAYIDESKYLVSNLPFILMLLLVGIFCLVMSKHLKTKYEKNINK